MILDVIIETQTLSLKFILVLQTLCKHINLVKYYWYYTFSPVVLASWIADFVKDRKPLQQTIGVLSTAWTPSRVGTSVGIYGDFSIFTLDYEGLKLFTLT